MFHEGHGWGGGQWSRGWRSSGSCPSSLGPGRRRGQGQVYRACVLSSMGSPRVSCWVSLSGGRLPFSVAKRSDRPLMRGNSMKSYRRAPMAPPIMGPTQYTCGQQTLVLRFFGQHCDRASRLPAEVDTITVMVGLTQWLTKFLKSTAGAKDLAGFIPAPV